MRLLLLSSSSSSSSSSPQYGSNSKGHTTTTDKNGSRRYLETNDKDEGDDDNTPTSSIEWKWNDHCTWRIFPVHKSFVSVFLGVRKQQQQQQQREKKIENNKLALTIRNHTCGFCCLLLLLLIDVDWYRPLVLVYVVIADLRLIFVTFLPGGRHHTRTWFALFSSSFAFLLSDLRWWWRNIVPEISKRKYVFYIIIIPIPSVAFLCFLTKETESKTNSGHLSWNLL